MARGKEGGYGKQGHPRNHDGGKKRKKFVAGAFGKRGGHKNEKIWGSCPGNFDKAGQKLGKKVQK